MLEWHELKKIHRRIETVAARACPLGALAAVHRGWSLPRMMATEVATTGRTA